MNLDRLITTCKPYLGDVYPFLCVLSQLWRHELSLKIYSTVINLNIVPLIIQFNFIGNKEFRNSFHGYELFKYRILDIMEYKNDLEEYRIKKVIVKNIYKLY